MLAVIDPYVPTPVKNVVRNVIKGVGNKIKSLKGLVFSTPIPAPRSIAQSPVPAPSPIVFKLTDRSLKNITRQYSYEAEGEQQDASVFLERVREGVMKILRENRNNKVNLVLTYDNENEPELAIYYYYQIKSNAPFDIFQSGISETP